LSDLATLSYYQNGVEIQTQEALAHAEEQNAELAAVRETLVDKETTISQLKEQVRSLLHEVASLSEAFTRLQVFLLPLNSFLLLSIPLLSTRTVPHRFQAGGHRKQPNLGLVCCV